MKTTTNKKRKAEADKRKESFLVAFEEWGTIRRACDVASIPRGTYERWHSEDPDFSKSVDLARRSFAESLEEIALERVRNPNKGKGSDVLLLGLLNANMPQKFRPQIGMNEDSAKELIVEWRKAAKEVKKENPTEEGTTGLPADVEKTLAEILEKRGKAPKEGKEQE
mgnify:CR=1 FL=1|jgi:hypothetical protein